MLPAGRALSNTLRSSIWRTRLNGLVKGLEGERLEGKRKSVLGTRHVNGRMRGV